MATPNVECQGGLEAIESSASTVTILPEPPCTERLSIGYICPGANAPPGSVFRLGLYRIYKGGTQPIGNSVYLNGHGEAIGRDPERTAKWVLYSLLAMPEEKHREVFRLIKDRSLEAGEKGEPLEDFSLVVNPVYPHEGAPAGALFGLDVLNVVGYRAYIVFKGDRERGDMSAIRGYGAMLPEEIYKSFFGLPEDVRDEFLLNARDYL